MELLQQLQIQPGVCAISGSGGKTSLMLHLARHLPGCVIVGTTTRIFPPELPLYTGGDVAGAAALLARHRVICAAAPAAQGKLAASPIPVRELARLADYVLLETDGSKHLPLKAHLAHEPVIPPEANRRILVVGCSGFGQSAEAAVHRPERFCRLAGLSVREPVLPRHVAAVIRAEALCDTVLVNQVDSPADLSLARELAACLPNLPVFAASVQTGRCQRV